LQGANQAKAIHIAKIAKKVICTYPANLMKSARTIKRTRDNDNKIFGGTE
jgi:hypothetical protein